ncbi:MAG: response regulator, partial [Coprobacillus sp.]
KKVRECYHDEMEMKLYLFSRSRVLKQSLEKRGYQLAFIEMNTEKTKGLQIAKAILEKCPACRIVFIIDQETYLHVHEALELSAFRYLKRPIHTEQFQELLDDAVEDYKSQDVVFYLHTSESKNCIFNSRDIKFIQTYYYDLEIVTHNRTFRSDVKNRYIIRPYLLPRHFVQVNQSVLVNMYDIDFMTDKSVILKTREVFNIGPKRIFDVHLKYDEFKRKNEKIGSLRGIKENENSRL